MLAGGLFKLQERKANLATGPWPEGERISATHYVEWPVVVGRSCVCMQGGLSLFHFRFNLFVVVAEGKKDRAKVGGAVGPWLDFGVRLLPSLPALALSPPSHSTLSSLPPFGYFPSPAAADLLISQKSTLSSREGGRGEATKAFLILSYIPSSLSLFFRPTHLFRRRCRHRKRESESSWLCLSLSRGRF